MVLSEQGGGGKAGVSILGFLGFLGRTLLSVVVPAVDATHEFGVEIMASGEGLHWS